MKYSQHVITITVIIIIVIIFRNTKSLHVHKLHARLNREYVDSYFILRKIAQADKAQKTKHRVK